ncbi:MAG: hypothetical protein Q8K45_02470 [Rubrivivax sp.]|nr:hypothetical protein [Rubrivivax sp.]
MSRGNLVGKGLLLAGLLGAGTGWAQDAQGDDSRVRRAGAPGSPFGQGSVSLLAGNDGSAISLNADIPRRSEIPEPGTDCGRQSCWARFTTYTARFDAPLAKGKKGGNLLTPDGLGSDASLTVGFTQAVSAWRDATGARDRLCAALWAELRRRAVAATERAAQALPEEAARLEAEAKALRKLADQGQCGSELLKQYTPALDADPAARAYRQGDLYFAQPGAWLYGAQVSYGVQDASFIDTTALKPADQRDEPWSLAAHLGWNPPQSPRSLYLLTLQRKRNFEEQDEGVACQSPGGVVNCVAGRLGGPTKAYASVVRVEGRWLVSSRYAASLIVARDRTAGRTTVDLPLHLLSTEAGALIAGINLGWRSDTGKGSIGVFVGTPFKLFP